MRGVFMVIQRNQYLKKLIDRQWNGQIKVITGIRRCGKSYLLRNLFKEYLLSRGVRDEQIIHFELDLISNIRYRNPLELSQYVHDRLDGKTEKFYLFIDEIQMSEPVKNPYLPDGKKITFYDALNDFKAIPNLDVYVTGSNSKMLSTDILTEFRGRGDEVRIHPLTFAEFYSATGGDKQEAMKQYFWYGGMPLVLQQKDNGEKSAYLSSLFSEVYLKDIIERKKIEYPDELSQILDLLCSSIGSLSNPTKIADTIRSKKNVKVSANTLKSYLEYLKDAFLFCECKRYDVRGKAYFEYPMKYYCEDIGLRNARTGFRQMEMTHIMENIVCSELRARDYHVDVGIVYENGKSKNGANIKISREIDFIATNGNRKFYIQSAFAMPDEEKKTIELKPFSLTGDSFPKIVIRQDIGNPWYDDNGFLNISLIDFLLDDSYLN